MRNEKFRKLAGEPLKIDFMITERCNLKCKMCNSWKVDTKERPNEVHYTKWIEVISELHDLIEVRLLCIGGGEPFLKEGVLEIIKHCTNLGIYTVIVSNGTLINEARAKAINDAGLKVLSISVDATEKVHDYMRGVPGTFQKAMQAIENMHKYSPKTSISISTMICKENIREIPDLLKWVQEDSRVESINFQVIQKVTEYTHRYWYKEEPLWPGFDLPVRALLNYLIDKKKAGWKIANPLPQFTNFAEFLRNPENASFRMRCKAGFSAFPCDPYGGLHLCPKLKSPGNILDTSTFDLYFNELAEAVRTKTYTCDEKCHYLINCYEENRENW